MRKAIVIIAIVALMVLVIAFHAFAAGPHLTPAGQFPPPSGVTWS